MNDRVRTTEQEYVEEMTGTQVTVVAGSIFGDFTIKPLTAKGAQEMWDKAHGRGFKIVRA